MLCLLLIFWCCHYIMLLFIYIQMLSLCYVLILRMLWSVSYEWYSEWNWPRNTIGNWLFPGIQPWTRQVLMGLRAIPMAIRAMAMAIRPITMAIRPNLRQSDPITMAIRPQNRARTPRNRPWVGRGYTSEQANSVFWYTVGDNHPPPPYFAPGMGE